ncbi:MAG: hypothetical protein AAF558_14365, partial [Verrucomicrobiota bacterium]
MIASFSSIEKSLSHYVPNTSWVRITVVLVFLFLLVGLELLLLNLAGRANHDYGLWINESGRQRMWSQRILRYLAQDVQGIPGSKEAGRLSIRSMQEQYESLISKKDSFPESVKRLYFEQPGGADELVNRLWIESEKVFSSDSPNPAILKDILREVDQKTLAKLDSIVATFQKEAETEIRQLVLTQIGLKCFTILTT